MLGKAKEIMIYEKEKRCEIIINNYTYGIYAAKERALEVLDEIQNILETRDGIQQMVYEMPID